MLRMPLSILALVLLAACGGASPQLQPLPADAVVLAFGDSLTHGTGAAAADSYPAVLETLIDVRVVRAGVPGEETAAGLARLPGVLDAHGPHLLLLTHGGNDMLRRRDPAQTADNLRAMVRMARERGIDVVLVAVPAPRLPLSPPAFYAEIASEHGVVLESSALRQVLSQGALRSDAVHPNADGYRVFAETIADVLRRSGAVP